MIQRELQQKETENTLLTYILKIKYPSTLFQAFMYIFSIVVKTWVRHNNRIFWMKSSVTQWNEYQFEWFSHLECE